MIMLALARIGLVNVPMLRKYRRYAGMGILLVGGFAAPDASPITMLLIAVPMYVLYEASIWIILVLEKSWHREAEPRVRRERLLALRDAGRRGLLARLSDFWFGMSLLAVWGVMTLIGVIVDQGKDAELLPDELRRRRWRASSCGCTSTTSTIRRHIWRSSV